MNDSKNAKPMRMNYELEEPGWAVLGFEYNDKSWEVDVSYLMDTLGDLVRGALFIAGGGGSIAIFIDSEGNEFLLTVTDESVTLINESNSQVVFDINTPPSNFLNEVVRVASEVLDQHGVDGYLEKWIQAPFPLKELELLKEKQTSIASL